MMSGNARISGMPTLRRGPAPGGDHQQLAAQRFLGASGGRARPGEGRTGDRATRGPAPDRHGRVHREPRAGSVAGASHLAPARIPPDQGGEALTEVGRRTSRLRTPEPTESAAAPAARGRPPPPARRPPGVGGREHHDAGEAGKPLRHRQGQRPLRPPGPRSSAASPAMVGPVPAAAWGPFRPGTASPTRSSTIAAGVPRRAAPGVGATRRQRP